VPGATAHEIRLVKTALAEREPKFDFDRDGDEFFVYVDEPHSARRTEKAVMHVLAERGVADRVAEPLPIGRWHENAHLYVFPGAEPDPEPVVPADEIGWVVVVRPASAFEWRPLRSALEHLGRTTIRETEHAIEVGARDEEDVDALRVALANVDCAGQTEARLLTWFQRWRLREQLLGNYSGEFDPTQP
jgi:hypothetical protein